MKNKKYIKRGEIYYADLGIGEGSEQSGTRPVLIVQNDKGNVYSPTTIVVALTSDDKTGHLPTHLLVKKTASDLSRDSTALFEQIRTINKTRLKRCIGKIDNALMSEVNTKLRISLEL